MKKIYTLLLALSISILSYSQQQVKISKSIDNGIITVSLRNRMVKQSIVIKNKQIFEDRLQSLKKWTEKYSNRKPATLITDANFELDVVYAAWRAPGKQYNADNPITFTKKDFSFNKYTIEKSLKGEQTINFWFSGINNSLTLQISYQLRPNEFFARRRISLTDKSLRGHYLDKIHVRKGKYAFYDQNSDEEKSVAFSVEGHEYSDSKNQVKKDENTHFEIINKGDFGQPIALKSDNAGAFGGIEFPTAINQLHSKTLDFYEYIGAQIKDLVVESDWTVLGITPEPYVKKWFYEYVKSIRVAPANPYVMYNSWYDLRSADYPDIPKDAVMNEENVMRIWNLVKENFIKKNNIKIDAFVLDDGWDIYESDWKLRDKQFPKGMRPIADEVNKSGTDLGLWFGPTGGYSFAHKRIQWMYNHGYEISGSINKYGPQLCLAGTNYSKLFEKRTTDFVKNDHIGYFKWDGIQFSCSEPDHGHPVGIYSRRAVMESVIEKCKAVRAINPDVYLNITSGTWLSPWWVKYANQIWMDAADYAFADVPSITRRDNAMTYRDYALFDDEHIRKSWFPISNLMIHGIIKGRLENISKGGETLESFTNNAILYFARGVSMWELYISPDILTPDEWNALSKSIKWAKDRFDVLSRTFMVGGNPANGNTYAFMHFKGKKGIIAARNPKVDKDQITVTLDPSLGIDENATGLVVEQVYPKRYIFPQIYAAGARVSIPLSSYETAIFEVYPLSDNKNMPLIAGVHFSRKIDNGKVVYTLLDRNKSAKVLNPETINKVMFNGNRIPFNQINNYQPDSIVMPKYNVSAIRKKAKTLITLTSDSMKETEQVAILLKTDKNRSQKGFPEVEISLNGEMLQSKTEAIKGKWIWYSVSVPVGVKPDFKLILKHKEWKGTAELWVKSKTSSQGTQIIITPMEKINERPMPPLPYPANDFKKYSKVITLKI